MTIPDPYWPRADFWLNQEHPDPEVLVVGVPSSKASLSPSRADLSPMAMRDRLARFSTFHGEWGVDFGQVAVNDYGNWPVSELDRDLMPILVGELAAGLPNVPLTLYLGGDNAITRPLVGAMAPDLTRIGVLTFDAHHDVRTLELGRTNGNPIRGLIDEDGLPGGNVIQIGIHSFANSAEYRAYCEEVGIEIVTISDVEAAGIQSVTAAALASLADHCDSIYVDIDIDVLDRAFAPACPGARPGGMNVRDLSEAARQCARHPKVTAIDFVEVDAEADHDGLTLDAMAHLMLSSVAGFAERET
jgi:formimidoylglutamase